MNFSCLFLLILTMVSCSSKSYVLNSRAEKCEVSSLGLDEQIEKTGLINSRRGNLCYNRMVKLPHSRHVHRMICNINGRNIPFSNYSEDKKSCELARSEFKKNPLFGIEDILLVSSSVSQQRQESNLWYLVSKNKRCTEYTSGGIKEMVIQIELEKKRTCKVTQLNIPGEPVKAITCGKSSVIVTESESRCQAILNLLRK